MSSTRKKIVAISGSTRAESVNLHILEAIAAMYEDQLDCSVFTGIDRIPHFNPDLDTETPPATVTEFRKLIEEADGVIICTPEYVFSLPGSLKNALEWMVSTIIFTNKPTALITASSSGQKAHEALQLVIKTIGARTSPETSLLIGAPKTKISVEGVITDETTLHQIRSLMDAFIRLLSEH